MPLRGHGGEHEYSHLEHDAAGEDLINTDLDINDLAIDLRSYSFTADMVQDVILNVDGDDSSLNESSSGLSGALSRLKTYALERIPSQKSGGSEPVQDTKKYENKQPHGIRHWAQVMFYGKTLSWKPMFLSILWSTSVVAIAKAAARDFPQRNCRWFCTRIAIDETTHSYVGFALFLLLAFRVNESYQRYLDGLKIWSSITGNISNMSKYILQAFKPGAFHNRDRERILGWLVAFPIALKQQLRDDHNLDELRSVLAPEDITDLENAESLSEHTLYIISSYIVKAQLVDGGPPATIIHPLINSVSSLRKCEAMCMQIKRIPVAFSYVAHLRVFLFLWLALLPFAMVEKLAWGTPAVAAFITYGLAGIELNAQELENPFGYDYNDLPLSMFTKKILKSVRATYKAAATDGTTSFVHETGPVEPTEGDQFWLDV